MQQTLPEELVMKRRATHLTRRSLILLDVTGLLMLLIVPVTIYVMVSGKQPDASLADQLMRVWQLMSASPEKLLHLLVLVVFMMVLPHLTIIYGQRERLVLNREGIRYETGLTGLLANLNPSWKLAWSEIRSLSMNTRIARGRLVIRPHHGRNRIIMLPAWFSRDENEEISKLPVLKRARVLQKRMSDLDIVRNSVLARYCAEIGKLQLENKPHSELDYDLMHHQATRISVILLFVLMAYGLVDFLANSETYIQKPPLAWFVTAGITTTLILAALLLRQRVPRANAIGVAAIFGMVLGLAMYPGILRINQLTDNRGLHPVSYQHITDYHFISVQSGLPEIAVEPDKYWLSLPEDAQVSFMLRRGGLGFYQVDMQPVYARMRQWYCRKRAAEHRGNLEDCRRSG